MSDRNRQLARIHCLKRDLALTDEDYRCILWTLCRERSAANLDAQGRGRVIKHLRGLLPKTTRKTDYPGKPKNHANWDRRELLSKIEALLADAGRPWAYAKGMAKHMFKKEALEFCEPDELYKIVQALEVDRKRRKHREAQRLLVSITALRALAGASWDDVKVMIKETFNVEDIGLCSVDDLRRVEQWLKDRESA